MRARAASDQGIGFEDVAGADPHTETFGVDTAGSASAFDGDPQGPKNLALRFIVDNSLGRHRDNGAIMQFEALLAPFRPGEEFVDIHFRLGQRRHGRLPALPM